MIVVKTNKDNDSSKKRFERKNYTLEMAETILMSVTIPKIKLTDYMVSKL